MGSRSVATCGRAEQGCEVERPRFSHSQRSDRRVYISKNYGGRHEVPWFIHLVGIVRIDWLQQYESDHSSSSKSEFDSEPAKGCKGGEPEGSAPGDRPHDRE